MVMGARENGDPAVAGPLIKSSQLKRKVLLLANRPSRNFYDLALSLSTLHEIKSASLEAVKHGSDLKRRTLYYLVNVGQFLRRYHVGKAKAEQIGWTKLQILARYLGDERHVSTDTLSALLDLVADTKTRDLPLALKGTLPSRPKRTILIRLTANDYKLVAQALLKHGAVRKGRGLINQEKALMGLVRAALKKDT